jgi:large subunit ribosomal protein L5
MADTATTPKAVKKETAKKAVPVNNTTAARLRVQYQSVITKELQKELGLKNIHQVPKLEKIVVNVGLGKAKDEKKLIDVAANTLRKITGQQPVETLAKNSIAGFKLREGNKIGLKVTLRADKMYEFMDRVINIVIPRLRDFHGVNPKSFDGQGNFALGFTDQSVFPELSFEETTTAHGLQVIFVIRAQEKAHARALLEKFGLPFEKEDK